MTAEDVRTKATARLRRWRSSLACFVSEEFGATLDPWQQEAAAHWDAGRQRLAMKACKGPGKTAFLAWVSWHFLVTRPHPKVAATSISSDNLRDGLWAEMALWQHRSVTGVTRQAFIWTATRIYSRDHPKTWFMSARAWSKSADATKQSDTLAGLHADYLLFVCDESGGYPDAVMAAAEGGLATGKEVRLVQAGNPTALEGPLYRACTTERHLWAVVEITGDPDDPKRASRISIQWAQEQIEKYGRENPWVLVNVMGRFPPSSLNVLLGPDDVVASQRRVILPEDVRGAAKIIGLDVARFGDDRTVLFPRQGLKAFRPEIMRNARTHEIAARVARGYDRWQADGIVVDDTGGWGAGVIDLLLQANYPVFPVNSSGSATDPRYYNIRAEMHFAGAEWVKQRGGALPDMPELVREATAAQYTFKDNKLLVQPKDQIKAMLGFSPDLWDAFLLTHAHPVLPHPTAEEAFVAAGKGKRGDFDPWREVR